MKYRSRYKTKNNISFLFVLLLAISVGYAFLTTQLNINGTAAINNNKWFVYWDNVVVSTGSVEATAPQIGQDTGQQSNTKVTWSVTLDKPGDFYEFTVDAVNNGTIDAMIDSINQSVTPSLPSYISYSITYADDTEIIEDQILAKKNGSTPTVQTYKVRVEFLKTISPAEMNAIPEGGVTYTFTFGVVYVQSRPAPPTIPSCPDCVFAAYNTPKNYSGFDIEHNKVVQRSKLTSFTRDYRKVKKDGNQRIVFLGHTIDNENTLQRVFVCSIKDYGTVSETPFCLEGTFSLNNSEYALEVYNNNKVLLQSLNLNDNCNEITSNNDTALSCEGDIYFRIDSFGNASIESGGYHCAVLYTGTLNCSR